MDNVVLNTPDPFDDDHNNEIIDVRIQQRTSRTYVTTIEGLINIDLEKVSKYMKKIFSCGATVVDKVIKLQGDQRQNVKNFLISEGIVNSEQIRIHGY